MLVIGLKCLKTDVFSVTIDNPKYHFICILPCYYIKLGIHDHKFPDKKKKSLWYSLSLSPVEDSQLKMVFKSKLHYQIEY